MSQYFPESKSSRGRRKVELDLSNYTTKVDSKNATGMELVHQNLLKMLS